MAIMTVEQFLNFAKTLPENVDRKKVARAMGVELPVEVKPLDEQLSNVGLIKHTPKAAKNKAPTETVYVEVPNLKLSPTESVRGFWVKASVARKVAARILELCDKNNL